jgi:hypothetical protein
MRFHRNEYKRDCNCKAELWNSLKRQATWISFTVKNNKEGCKLRVRAKFPIKTKDVKECRLRSRTINSKRDNSMSRNVKNSDGDWTEELGVMEHDLLVNKHFKNAVRTS